jgi:hypothetical protein
VVSTVETPYIGGIDRLDFDMTWTCGTGLPPGEPMDAHFAISVYTPPFSLVSSGPTTLLIPDPGPTRWGMIPTHSVGLAGSGLPRIELNNTLTAGYFTLRLVGGRLVGGLYVEATGQLATSVSVIVAGSFDVPLNAP